MIKHIHETLLLDVNDLFELGVTRLYWPGSVQFPSVWCFLLPGWIYRLAKEEVELGISL